jgi:tmRNA-binding protein
MSFQLTLDEPVSDGLKRLMIEECHSALSYLNNATNDDEKHLAVHEVRKSFKRIRAGLRLVRDRIDYYPQENVWFRDRGRNISSIRNTSADLEVLFLYQQKLQSAIGESQFDNLYHQLVTHREIRAKTVFYKEKQLDKLRDALEEKAETIFHWSLNVKDFSDVQPGLSRTYNRGRRAIARSRRDQIPENFHYMRKRAKYLCHQLEIIKRIWPPMLTIIEDELHQLTDFIGTYLNLEHLKVSIKTLDNLSLNDDEKATIASFVKVEQHTLKNRALLKGRKLYCEKPSRFSDSLELYWYIFKKEQDKGI